MSLWHRLWPFGRGHPGPDPDMEQWRRDAGARNRRTTERRDRLDASIARAERVRFEPTMRERLTGREGEYGP